MAESLAYRATGLYVCQTCGRLAALRGGFDDECHPGHTHGRLWPVLEIHPSACSTIQNRPTHAS